MAIDQIQKILKENPELQDKLYARGFLFTNDSINPDEYPFYGLWKTKKVGTYSIFVSPKQTYYICKNNENTCILVGHAYNPIDMIYEEDKILSSLLNHLTVSNDEFYTELNKLTGIFTLIFVSDDKVFVTGDATCMQTTFYISVNEKIYISSHTNLLGDLLHLQWDPYVKRLSHYRFFSLLGNSLPGNITQFKEVKRLVPNHIAIFENNSIREKRFFWPQKYNLSNIQIEEEVSKLLNNNLKLICKKWEKPAISMTGGCDSKTTLACAKGVYDKYSYFSYTSSESENVDAVAAHKICNALDLKHTIYEIPTDDSNFPLIDEVQKLLDWNSGDIIPSNRNDVRKRCFFADTTAFDVEVKSWASEIGRAYFSKRFNGRTNFGKKPTPRACTTLYKFFLHNRKLVRETDSVFEEYLKKFFEQADTNPVEWQEQFFWEFRVPSWNGLVITGEHRYSFDITIPYNNRIILSLLLSAPIQDRIDDRIYSEIRNLMNPVIDKTGVSVTNLKHTKKREKFENIYYSLHSKIPF